MQKINNKGFYKELFFDFAIPIGLRKPSHCALSVLRTL